MITRSILSLSILAALGCSKGSGPAESAAKTSDSTAATESTEERASPTEVAAEPLPPIELTVAEALSRKTADAKNSEALAKQKAGDYDAAIALYREALAADPSHILARYNLACAHSKAGHREQALALLREIAEVPDCAVCQGRLVRAQKDPDFEALKEDAEFVAITGGAKLDKLSTKQATRQFLQVLGGADKLPAHLIHPRNPIRIETVNGNCDPGPDDDCKGSTTVVGADQLRELIEFSPLLGVEVDTCDRDCCKLSSNDQPDGDAAVRLDRLCWSADSGGVRTLARLAYTEGP